MFTREKRFVENYCFGAGVSFAWIGWCDSLSRRTRKNYSRINSDFFRYIRRNNDLRSYYCLLLPHRFQGLFQGAILRPCFLVARNQHGMGWGASSNNPDHFMLDVIDDVVLPVTIGTLIS